MWQVGVFSKEKWEGKREVGDFVQECAVFITFKKL